MPSYGMAAAPATPVAPASSDTSQMSVPTENFEAAKKDLNLTPQEQALYQTHLTNLYGQGGVDNPDGSRSTLYQASFSKDGKTYNVPTVYNGKIVPPADAIAMAQGKGLDNYPSYGSEKEAEDRYQAMHSYMERDTQQFLRARRRGPS